MMNQSTRRLNRSGRKRLLHQAIGEPWHVPGKWFPRAVHSSPSMISGGFLGQLEGPPITDHPPKLSRRRHESPQCNPLSGSGRIIRPLRRVGTLQPLATYSSSSAGKLLASSLLRQVDAASLRELEMKAEEATGLMRKRTCWLTFVAECLSGVGLQAPPPLEETAGITPVHGNHYLSSHTRCGEGFLK